MTVRARRRAMTRELGGARGVGGRILDLGGAESHRSLWSGADAVVLDGVADPALLALADRAERFDTIVSVMQLATVPDLAGTIAQLAGLLGPDGKLHFLEPGRLTGVSGRAQRLAAPLVTISTGFRLDRDIPHQLRSNHLSVTSLQRHRTATTQWWHRLLVEGTAHRALPFASDR